VPKDATLTTLAQNCAVLDALPFGDAQDFEDVRRGFLGSLPKVERSRTTRVASCGA
jgi:alkyl sulfatase BDS1-like metallo-beta-lactamase superfamily hydrolase